MQPETYAESPRETSLSDLRDRPIFVCWKEVARGERRTKVPFDPATGHLAKSDDPSTWGTREAADRRAKRLLNGSRTGGVGVMLGSIDDSTHLAGIDLDACLDPLQPHAAEIVGRFGGAYVEVSPSGKGLKLYFRVRAEHLPMLRKAMGRPHGKSWTPGTGKEIALHLSNRYFAVTGEGYGQSPDICKLVGPLDALGVIGLAPLLWLIHEAGPDYKRGKPKDHDPSGSGALFRLAGYIKAAGGTREDFEEAIGDDDAAAAHAETGGQRALDRAWGNNSVITIDPEEELTDDDVSLVGWRGTAASGRLTFTRPDECATMPVGAYLWKGVLAPGDLACIVGAPGAGKSLLAPFLGYMAALGAPAFGKRTRRTGPVFYVAAEDEAGMRARVAALRDRHGSTDAFVVIGGVGDLFRDKAPDLAALRAAVAEQRPSLIFIDTLAQAFPGLDENEAKSMTHVVKVGRLLAEHGAAVVLVHHTTKDGGSLPRGSGVLNGALDASILVEAGMGGVVSGRLTKNRRGPAGSVLAFEIGTRSVGKDIDGEPVTVAYAEPVDAEPKGREATKAGRAALAVLARLSSASRKPVEEERWRKACAEDRAVTAAEKPDDRRKVVTRVFQALARDGFITVRDGTVCLPGVDDELTDDDVAEPGQTGPIPDMSGLIPPAKRPEDRTDRTRAFRPGPVSGSAMPNNRMKAELQ